MRFNEDIYYDRLFDEYERRKEQTEEEFPEESWLFLDDETDEIEEKAGCRMEELYEADLFEILDRMVEPAREWISAAWDRSMWGIRYTYAA